MNGKVAHTAFVEGHNNVPTKRCTDEVHGIGAGDSRKRVGSAALRDAR